MSASDGERGQDRFGDEREAREDVGCEQWKGAHGCNIVIMNGAADSDGPAASRRTSHGCTLISEKKNHCEGPSRSEVVNLEKVVSRDDRQSSRVVIQSGCHTQYLWLINTSVLNAMTDVWFLLRGRANEIITRKTASETRDRSLDRRDY